MVFLAVFLFAAYANLILAIRGLVAKGRAALIAQAHFLCCLTGALGLLLGFELVPDPRKGIAGDAYNWSPVPFFGFGLLTVLLFGGRLILLTRERSVRNGPGLRVGMAIWAVAAGLYICGTVADHWMFFHHPDQAGVVAPSLVGPNVKCHTAVLVRLDGGTAVYRCPKLVVFGSDYSRPFVPWPSFTQGEADGKQMNREAASATAAAVASKAGVLVAVPANQIRVMQDQ
jgi:hypothetical protein